MRISLLFALTLTLWACGSDDSAADLDASVDSSAPDAADALVEEETELDRPLSSACIGEWADDHCQDGLQAETWAGADVFWRIEDMNRSTIWQGGEDEDTLLATLETSAGQHIPWGLSVAPDGGLFLSGVALSAQLEISGHTMELQPENAYSSSFVIHLDADGAFAWAHTVSGLTGERVSVLARRDGSAVLAGDLFQAAAVGPFELEAPEWVFDCWIAAIDAEGEWLWAAQSPRQGQATGDFKFSDLELSDDDRKLHVRGTLRGTLTFDGEDRTCPPNTFCDAVMTRSADGELLDLTFEAP